MWIPKNPKNIILWDCYQRRIRHVFEHTAGQPQDFLGAFWLWTFREHRMIWFRKVRSIITIPYNGVSTIFRQPQLPKMLQNGSLWWSFWRHHQAWERFWAKAPKSYRSSCRLGVRLSFRTKTIRKLNLQVSTGAWDDKAKFSNPGDTRTCSIMVSKELEKTRRFLRHGRAPEEIWTESRQLEPRGKLRQDSSKFAFVFLTNTLECKAAENLLSGLESE